MLIFRFGLEVDEAVQQQRQDGTGGRGFNGHITSALEEAQKGGQAGKNSSGESWVSYSL